MSIIVVILIGLFVGWVVAAVLELDEGIFAHMLLGAVGAVVAALIHHLLDSTTGLFMITWGTTLWSTLGALLLTGITMLITRPKRNSGA